MNNKAPGDSRGFVEYHHLIDQKIQISNRTSNTVRISMVIQAHP